MSLRTSLFIGVTATLAGLPATALARGPAAAPLQCGQTITASTTLTTDLVGCAGNGLVVGADGITIHLAGHAIRGTNAPGSVGIVVDGHRRVTIAGGTIDGFFRAGVSLHESPNGVVRRLRVAGIGAGGVEGKPSAGILVEASAGTRILDNSVRNDVEAFQSDGVVVLSSPGTVVRRNRLERNAWNGLVVIESPRSRVVGNRLAHNGNNGLEVNGASDGAVVAYNRAPRNAQFGVVVGASRDVRVVGNQAWGNGAPGVLLFDLIDGLVAGNHARRNAVGIVLADGQHGSHGNRLVHNRAVGNADGGIFVEEEQAGAAAGNTLARNVANRNGGHGIDAVEGTIDGGGNRAHGNRTPPDCLGVTCS